MKDTEAEIVADRLAELVEGLERAGLRRFSILAGIEAGLRRERNRDATPPASM